MNYYNKVGFVILVLFSLIFQGCSRKMSDEDFIEISNEWIVVMTMEAFNPANWDKTEEEIDEIAKARLEEICKKHGYRIEDYMRKYKEMEERQREADERLREFFRRYFNLY